MVKLHNRLGDEFSSVDGLGGVDNFIQAAQCAGDVTNLLPVGRNDVKVPCTDVGVEAFLITSLQASSPADAITLTALPC